MGKKILLIDDDIDIRDTITFLLTNAGYTVDTCCHGQDIFTTIEQSSPDLILLDVHIGEVDGRDLCKLIRSNPKTSFIPILMVSSIENIYNIINEHGANDVIEKPFTEEILLTRISRQLGF